MKSFLSVASVVVCTLVLFSGQSVADQIDCGNYRIALSFDGNAHDPDDIIASPLALAMIAEAGLKDKFVFCDFSNHIWNDDGRQPAEMRTSIDGVCERWGIDRSKLFEARVSTELNKAKTAFRNAAIEAYNAGATLYYACGGPMEVPYQMVSNLEAKYRAVVTVISHHWWNDEHGTVDKHFHKGARDWNDLKAIAGNNIHIDNQNEDCWSSSVSSWSWLGQKGGDYKWLFDRNPFGTKKFDGSDAGITYYIITGRGNQNAVMNDAKWIFNDSHSCGPVNAEPTVSITAPANNATFKSTESVSVSATASDEDGSITKVELRKNGTLVSADNASPYSWDLTGLTPGTYTLQARAYDNQGATKNSSITIYVTDADGNLPAMAINAGGGEHSGSDGTTWLTDTYSTDGKTGSSNNAISGTEDDAIYQTDRYETSLEYAIAVPNGTYFVTLKFAEVYFTAAGDRVFDVSLEGTEVISNLDIFAKVGQNAAYDETHSVTVSDGTLNITLSADVNKAKVCGIVISSSDPTAAISPRTLSTPSSLWSSSDLAKVSFYDMSGRQVFSGVVRNAASLNPASLGFNERGVYMVRIHTKSGTHNRKILVK